MHFHDMHRHMRTTIDLSDALVNRVKKYMKRHKTTLRAVVEAGIERVLEERAPERGFQVRDASFLGAAGFASGSAAEDIPQRIRELNDPAVRWSSR